MISLLINIVVGSLLSFYNISSFQLVDPAKIIVNNTLPKTVDDIVINQVEGGDINRALIYPVKKNNAALEPTVTAASVLVVDANTGLVLLDKNSKTARPIASITKLMTALVFIDEQQKQGDKLSWNQVIDFSEDDINLGKSYLNRGEQITIKDLFSTLLVASTNSAAITLVRATGLSMDEFVAEMNAKAKELDMLNTHFSEPTGLDANNSASARDLAKLVYRAMRQPEITELVTLPEYEFYLVNKNKKYKIYNTDWLLKDDWLTEQQYKFIGGKTGYTDQAGYNFASQIIDNNQHSVISIVLGAATIDQRFSETKEIVNWSFNNYKF